MHLLVDPSTSKFPTNKSSYYSNVKKILLYSSMRTIIVLIFIKKSNRYTYTQDRMNKNYTKRLNPLRKKIIIAGLNSNVVA